MRPKKPCRHCGRYGHWPYQCFSQRKAVTQKGKHFKRWMETREKWFERHQSRHYYCYICGRKMTKKETTLDHIKARSRHPELRYRFDNLAPCCGWCNYQKGSKSLEQFLIERESQGGKTINSGAESGHLEARETEAQD